MHRHAGTADRQRKCGNRRRRRRLLLAEEALVPTEELEGLRLVPELSGAETRGWVEERGFR